MEDDAESTWTELSFLAPPGETLDWRMAVLYNAAVETGLLDGLPASPASLALELGLDEQAVRVVLEAMVAWNVIEAAPDHSFALGPGAPEPDAGAILCHHARTIRLWSSHLDDRLRGVPHVPRGPRRLERMLKALAVNGRESAPAAVDACLQRAPTAGRVLDLGGGHGEYALEFARRGLQATVQDQPEVIEIARRQGHLVEAGVTLFAGDFFKALPDERFDLVFCAGVTYTFDGGRNVAVYRRARSVLAPGGALAVHTFLRGTDPLAAVFAVQMLAGGSGGDTHGEEDHRRWLAEAGYRDVAAVRLERRPEWMIFARDAVGQAINEDALSGTVHVASPQ